MTLQKTVVELFQENRIDKATAYRLLSECKKAAAGGDERITVSARLPRHDDDSLVLAAWACLLQLISGSNELAIAHVDRSGCRSLHLRLDPLQTGRQLADQIRSQYAAGHQASGSEPYAWVTEEATDSGTRRISARISTDDSAAFALEFRCLPQAQGATRASDWPDTLAHLLRALQEAPATPLAALDKLPARHRHLLTDYNATHAYLPPKPCLPALLDPLLGLEHEAIAVETRTATLNYAGYTRHAWQLARLLRELGAQPNERIAVVLSRSERMPPSLYGVVCSGAAYVPLEPDMPAARLKGILQDTAARFVVTDAETLHQETLALDQTGIERVICIDPWPRARYHGVEVMDRRSLDAMRATAPEPVNAPDDLCYVIYTSGSTGKPKGVMISHLNIVNTLIGVNNVFSVGADDKILCFSSYGFDLSVWDIFGAALAGATVFIPGKREIRDPAALLRILSERGVTIWDSVPTGMSQLLLPLAGKVVAPVESLRLAMLSGEFIPLGLPADIHAVFPNCRVASLGGATEGTVWSIYYAPVERIEPGWKSIPYGRPLPNQRFHVLNEELRPCAIGEKGMLYIGGLGVAQGYLGDAERTARAFIPAPWPNEPGGRIYRTGDLGIMHANGLIEIAGRADQQVKIRGYRVELGEVESQLNALRQIDQAAVIAKLDGVRPASLVAFYTSRDGEIPAETLRKALAERLPDYMIPARFVHLANPPVGASGKLDRAALDSMPVSREGIGMEYVAPQDDAERHLATALARILRLERVGVDDDFLLIGGDSLLALQYLSALSQLGFQASPIDIQQGRTIRGVLARARRFQAPADADADLPVPLGPMGRKFIERLPLQDRAHWNQSIVIRFDHEPDRQRLQTALQRVVAQHPLLRAGLTEAGLQVADCRIALSCNALDRLPFWRRGSVYRRLVDGLQASIRLDAGNMCKAMLVTLRRDDVRLVWVAHHLVVDAHCWRVLVEDLVAAYRNPEAPLLRAMPYRHYAAMMDAAAPHASQMLARTTPLVPIKLPGLRPGADPVADNRERDAGLLQMALPADDTRRLFAAAQGDTAPGLHLVLLTAFATALGRWTEESNVRFDIVSNGRDVDPTLDASRTIGWFATHNPFAARIPARPDAALTEIAAAWRTHQDSSRHFVAACNLARTTPGHPFAACQDQVLLYNYLGVFDSLDLPEGWSVLGSAGRERGPDNPRTHLLELDLLVAGGVLRLALRYGRKLQARRHPGRLLALYRTSLLELIRHLETRPVTSSTPAAAGDASLLPDGSPATVISNFALSKLPQGNP